MNNELKSKVQILINRNEGRSFTTTSDYRIEKGVLYAEEISEPNNIDLNACSDEQLAELYSELLFETYRQWREERQALLDDGMYGSVDCGENSVRCDFNRYAGLTTFEDEPIDFEEMFELEKAY